MGAGTKRDNFKLIKHVSDLAAELTAGGGSKYLLTTNTLYEINGAINLAHPIDLNNATVAGLDGLEDKLQFTGGTVFKGITGGNIKNVTLKGGKAFEITGPGTTTSSLIVQNVIIDGMTSSVGSISGLGLYFGNIIQYMNNTNGITYSNIGNLLLSNQGWFAGNSGTYETFTGNFGLIEKVSGFSTVNSSAIGMDFNSNPSVGTGVVLGHVFSGNTTNGYVKGYNPAPYAGYNFTNAWTVESPGVPREGDGAATGNFHMDASTVTNFGNSPTTPKKLEGNTTTTNLYRFENGSSEHNKIYYRGNRTRYFQVDASISFVPSDISTYIFSLAVNGVPVDATRVYTRPDAGDNIFTSINPGHTNISLGGTLKLKKNDYVEVFAQRVTRSGNVSISTASLNLSIK